MCAECFAKDNKILISPNIQLKFEFFSQEAGDIEIYTESISNEINFDHYQVIAKMRITVKQFVLLVPISIDSKLIIIRQILKLYFLIKSLWLTLTANNRKSMCISYLIFVSNVQTYDMVMSCLKCAARWLSLTFRMLIIIFHLSPFFSY